MESFANAAKAESLTSALADDAPVHTDAARLRLRLAGASAAAAPTAEDSEATAALESPGEADDAPPAPAAEAEAAEEVYCLLARQMSHATPEPAAGRSRSTMFIVQRWRAP